MASGASRDSPGSQVPPMPGNTLHCRFEAPPPSSSSTKRCNQTHPATVQLGPRPSLPSFSPRFPPGPGPASAWVGTIRPFLPGSAPPYSTPLLRLVQSESSLQVSPPRPRPRSGQTRHLPRRPRPGHAPRVWRNRPAAYGRRLSQLRPSGAPPHLASSPRGSGRRIPRLGRARGAAAMAVTAEGARRKERVLCLFDVDGTLTPARQVRASTIGSSGRECHVDTGGRMWGLQWCDRRVPETECAIQRHPAPVTPGAPTGSDGHLSPHVTTRGSARPRSAG